MTAANACSRSRAITLFRAYLYCFVAIWLCGCESPDRQTIRFAIPTAAADLDPRFATDAVSDRISRLLFRALVVFDEYSMPQPDLGSWQRKAPDRYRIALEAGATFASGRAITADDVAATYRSVLHEKNASPHRESLVNISSVDVIDERTVEFRLHQPDSLFPGTLVLGIMSADDIDKPVSSGRDYSGPFVLTSRSEDGSIALRRRSDGQRVDVVVVKDMTARALRLLAGDVDVAQGGFSPEVFSWLARQPRIRAVSSPGSTFAYIGFNMNDDVTGNRLVRQAIAHAIDRESIIRHVFNGTARAANGLFPPEHWAGSPELAGPSFDPELSKKLLAEAGYENEPLTIEYKTSSNRFRLRVATIIQHQLSKVGVRVKILSYDWGSFYGDIKAGRFQSYGLSWVGLNLPDIFRYAFHSGSIPPKGANRGRYVSASVDRLIEAAESAADQTERKARYREISEKLLFDLPYIPLWYEDQLVVKRDDIDDYSTNRNGHFDGLVRTTRSAN